jgi:hypothetical protein
VPRLGLVREVANFASSVDVLVVDRCARLRETRRGAAHLDVVHEGV